MLSLDRSIMQQSPLLPDAGPITEPERRKYEEVRCSAVALCFLFGQD